MTNRSERCVLARLAGALLAIVLASAGTTRGQTFVTDTGAPTTSFMAPLSMPGVQPFWLGYVGADRGLGFQGQYFSFGGLLPITTDVLDGTWFVDGRAHVTTEYANFFSNIGIGRRAYFEPLNAIIGLSGWYDYDGDAYQNYGYRYNQMGVTAEVFNPVCDFRFNGYFPMGANSHVLNQFQQNYLLYVNGIDTALHGGDAKFSLRPAFLGPLNGYIDIGGYIYKSPVVETFGGVSTGFGVQPLPGLAVNMEVNHDEFFGTTGFVRVAFGLRGSPGNTRTGTRLLEPTRRNDHIVRFNQQPEIATNPDTNSYYNVIHVDNSAPGGGDGTVEHPYNTLAAAQAASATHDVIYVHRGDGTTNGYNAGIVLKDYQQLLGSGNNFVMRSVEVGNFMLWAHDTSGPNISNPGGFGVTLANDDRVGGMNIDQASIGIYGNGITTTNLEQNSIRNMQVDGIQLAGFHGVGTLWANTIFNSYQDGMHFSGGDGTYIVTGNNVGSNIRNGIFFEKVNGSALVQSNVLGTNGRGNWAGLHVIQFANTFNLEARDNYIQSNTEGIYIDAYNLGTTVNADIHDNPQISYNQGDGIQLAARAGATLNTHIHDNPNISYNGRPDGIGVNRMTGAGAGMRFYVLDSTFNALINNNNLTGNAGNSNPTNNTIDQAAGVQGLFEGDSITSLTFISNVVNGLQTFVNNNVQGNPRPYGDGIDLFYNTTNDVIQNIDFQGNEIINSRGGGVLLGTATNPLGIQTSTAVVNATFNNNVFTNNEYPAIAAFQNSTGAMRLTITNNQFLNNGAPNPPAGSRGTVLNDGAIALASNFGNLVGIIENNIINKNGINAGVGAPDVHGIAAHTFGSGTMGLQIIGNQINQNAGAAIRLTAENTSIFPSALGAIIRDNMMLHNGGPDAVSVLTASQTPANTSAIAVEFTHNEASTPYRLTNLQTSPDSATIVYADGGLNAGEFYPIGPGTVTQDTVANVDALIAPLLVFP